MPQRKWTTEQKMAMVLEGLRGQTKVAEICRQHSISQNQYYLWRDQFLAGAQERLAA